MYLKPALAAMVISLPLMAEAQQFTTADEVKPILSATKANWVSVREYEGQDLLYFTHLMAWRCGIDAIYYSINGAAEVKWQGEPCYMDEVQPNAIKAEGSLPFIGFGLQSIQSVDIHLIYDDASEDRAHYERASIMTP